MTVGKEKFRHAIFDAGLCEQNARIRNLAKVILEQKRTRPRDMLDPALSGEDDLVLGDIEDFALGFMQNNTKLFAFGRVAAPLGRFEHEPPATAEMNLLGDKIDKHLLRNKERST